MCASASCLVRTEQAGMLHTAHSLTTSCGCMQISTHGGCMPGRGAPRVATVCMRARTRAARQPRRAISQSARTPAPRPTTADACQRGRSIFKGGFRVSRVCVHPVIYRATTVQLKRGARERDALDVVLSLKLLQSGDDANKHGCGRSIPWCGRLTAQGSAESAPMLPRPVRPREPR